MRYSSELVEYIRELSQVVPALQELKTFDSFWNNSLLVAMNEGDCDIIMTSLGKPVIIRFPAAGSIVLQDIVTEYLKHSQKENAIEGPVG